VIGPHPLHDLVMDDLELGGAIWRGAPFLGLVRPRQTCPPTP